MKYIHATAVLAALAVSPVYAACTMPAPVPTVPDVSTANAADIISSQKDVVAFSDATTAYLGCVKQEHDSAIAAVGPGITSVQADKINGAANGQHDAAVKQLNGVVDRFNTLVHDFQQKQADAKAQAAAAKAAKKQK